MKITAFDDTHPLRLAAGGTLFGGSGGSNSGYTGGDVTGQPGDLSVIRLGNTVSLSSNMTGAIGDVLTLIQTGPLVAQFATPSNSFGSNSTRVSAAPAAGSQITVARSDHIHDGIGQITASSSNTLGRGTVNLRPGNGLAFALSDSDGNGDLDTVTMQVSFAPTTVGIVWVIDGGGVAITTGTKGDLPIPFNCTITGWTILLDQSGSIVIDIWKDVEANYPPTASPDSITASAKPTVSSAARASSNTLTGWTTSLLAGDTLRFNVDSITTATRATIMLRATRTS